MTTTRTLDIITPPDEPTVHLQRFFRAPLELVFAAWTQPAHVRQWWGPRRLELVVCEIDLRVGGTYHFVHRAPDGQEFGFHGEFRELDPPNRIVNTFIYEGAPDDEAVETVTFEAAEGGTVVRTTARHASVAARDGHVAAGMESGIIDSYERLDELLASLSS